MGMKMMANFIKYRKEGFLLKTILEKLNQKLDLSQDEATAVMDDLTDGNFSEAQIAAFLVSLNAKGIKAAEIAGCASVLRAKKTPFEIVAEVTDTCGTGGDGTGTFNISSMTAIGLSALGQKIAKHGNKAVSSLTGCADFYQELGIPMTMTPAQSKALFDRTGFAFLFAPTYHSAMRHAAKVRKELGIKTIMNLLGPLANPADAAHQIIGVFAPEFLRPVAEAASMLGVKNIMTVHSDDGQDEISIYSKTRYCLIRQGKEPVEGTIDPKDFDLPVYSFADIRGGDAKENAAMARSVMANEGYEGLRDAVCLNMGAALMVSNRTQTIKEGYLLAREAFNNGSVKNQFQKIIDQVAVIGAEDR
jgi:anthranilate synthase/phosphoribosyltransferase